MINRVYQLKCLTCHKKYIGQTGRRFACDFANTVMTTNMRTVYENSLNMCQMRATPLALQLTLWTQFITRKKGRMLDMLEKQHIYRETQNVNQINDKLTVQKTPIFETNTTQPHRRQHPQTAENTTTLTHSRLQAQFVGRTIRTRRNKNQTQYSYTTPCQSAFSSEGTNVYIPSYNQQQILKTTKNSAYYQ